LRNNPATARRATTIPLPPLLYSFLLIAFTSAIGCREITYAPPHLPVSHVATLKASGSTFIDEIDGRTVEGGAGIAAFGLVGGNETTVIPGRHEIKVEYQSGNGYTHFRLLLDLSPNTTYHFEGKAFSQRLEIINQTTTKTSIYDGSTLTIFDSTGQPHPWEKPWAP
jgi:hypothetical protein